MAGSAPEALLTFWCCGEVWRARRPDGVAFDLHAGDTIDVGDRTLRCVSIPLGDAGRDRTRADVLGAPMRIVEERDVLRRRWDILLVRLRERLREAGLRTDLVRSSRLGLVELVLQEGDVLDDRS